MNHIRRTRRKRNISVRTSKHRAGSRRHRRARRAVSEIGSAVGALIFPTVVTTATPTSSPNTGSSRGYEAPAKTGSGLPAWPVIVRGESITDRWARMFVQSPTMHREMQVQVLQPADRSRRSRRCTCWTSLELTEHITIGGNTS